MVKHYAEITDRVVVLISPVDKKLDFEKLSSISAGLSSRIWQIYLDAANLANVDVEISEFNSPVQASMEYGNKPKMHGKNVILGASTKGGDAAQRFAGNLQKYAPHVNILDPMRFAFTPTGEVLSATDFRSAIENEDILTMEKHIPKEVKAAGRVTDVLNLLNVDTTNLQPDRSGAVFDLSLEEATGADEVLNLIEQELEEGENFMTMRDDGQTGEWSSGKKKKDKKDDSKEKDEEEEGDSGDKRVKNKIDQVVTVTKKIKSKVDQEVVSEMIEDIFKIFNINEAEEEEEEDLEENSTMSTSAVEGGGKKKEDETKNSLIREKDQIIDDVLDYLSK